MSDMHMRQWKASNPGEFWTGAIRDIKREGITRWSAVWENHLDGPKNILITLDEAAKKISIHEDRSNQTWVGSYAILNDAYLIDGEELGKIFQFSARLVLPQ